jgi:ABC-2 type transport system permease protein
MRHELIMAGKEFRDHLTSKRFIIIFAILVILSLVSMAGGMAQYNKTLDIYKKNLAQNQQQSWFIEQVTALQNQIANPGDLSAGELGRLKNELAALTNPPMPSVLTVFTNMNQYLVIVTLALSVAMGFDLVSREKEEGSLKSLLSHPIYRDAIINGKLMGSVAVLTLVMGLTFMIALAVMLFYGIIPGGDDLIRIGAYFLAALLFCCVFFAIAAMTSTIAKSSIMSVLFALGIIITMYLITSFSGDIAGVIQGPAPEFAPPDNMNSLSAAAYADASRAEQYYEQQTRIVDTVNTISPVYDFYNRISYAILYKAGDQTSIAGYGATQYREPGLLDSLASVWVNILALLIEMIIPLSVSYMVFMRTDIR